MPLFKKAAFLLSAAALSDLPARSRGEIAFAGRSNAGKSSVINSLSGKSRLAFVSKTPGRTRLLNIFALGEERYLVDLPGYGYARIGAAERSPWDELLGSYLKHRKPLKGVALVMDIRHPLTALDRHMLEWFAPVGKPVHVLLTKSDKVSRARALHTLDRVKIELRGLSPRFTVQLFSSPKKVGIEEAENVFHAWLV